MSINTPLTGIVNNDLSFAFALTYDGEKLNLANYTIAVYLKASQTTPDSSATTFSPSPSIATAGEFTWAIPRADNTTAGVLWYRVDVINGSGDVATCAFGPLTILAA